MKYRSVGLGAELLDSDYYKAELVLASEAIVKETLAIKDADDYVLINDDNVEFYSVVKKNGINSLAHSALRVAGRAIPFVGAFTGPLAVTVSRRHFGGDSTEKLTFIKLKNGKRVLMIIKEGYSHLICSKNKQRKDDLSEDDLKWIKQALDKNDIELV